LEGEIPVAKKVIRRGAHYGALSSLSGNRVNYNLEGARKRAAETESTFWKHRDEDDMVEEEFDHRDRHCCCCRHCKKRPEMVSNAGTDCPHGEYFIPYNSYGKRLSDLELFLSIESSSTFAQNYRELLSYHLETGWQAIQIIKASLPEKGYKATICHGDPSPRNTLCLPDGRWVLLDWDRLVRAPRWWELSQVIRRFQNQNAWKEWPLWDSIHKHVKPLLQPDETTALLGCLLFPQEFWRLGDQYFREKLNRPESWFLRRLEALQRIELNKNLTLLKWARLFDISVQLLKPLVNHK
jgi:hypothetical protein